MNKSFPIIEENVPVPHKLKIGQDFRFCADIGLYAFDRPKSTCGKYCSPFCVKHCYNNDLRRCYTDKETGICAMNQADVRYEVAFRDGTLNQIGAWIRRYKDDYCNRIRACTRGEPCPDRDSIRIVRNIALQNPDQLVWVPTRAWHAALVDHRNYDPELYQALLELRAVPNVRMLASIDPSDSLGSLNLLLRDGWSTMFFGNDHNHPLENVEGINLIKCAKTFEHKKGSCATCDRGCFSNGVKHIWLKEH